MKIERIEYADSNDSTAVTHKIHLSDGQVLSVWSGQPCYTCLDTAEGAVEGAYLLNVVDQLDNKGESYKHYLFGEPKPLAEVAFNLEADGDSLVGFMKDATADAPLAVRHDGTVWAFADRGGVVDRVFYRRAA